MIHDDPSPIDICVRHSYFAVHEVFIIHEMRYIYEDMASSRRNPKKFPVFDIYVYYYFIG